MTSVLKGKIIDLRKQGKIYKEISEELGCSKSTVSHHCRKAGIGAPDLRIDENTISDMQRYYDECGSSNKVAEKFGFSRSTVTNYIQLKKIKPILWKKKERGESKLYKKEGEKLKIWPWIIKVKNVSVVDMTSISEL